MIYTKGTIFFYLSNAIFRVPNNKPISSIDNNPLQTGNINVDENLDQTLSEIHSKINALKAELNYYHEDGNCI